MKLVNSTTYEGREYTIQDNRGFIPCESKEIPLGFYGGRVTRLALTDTKGVYLCMENMNVIDILVLEHELEPEELDDKEPNADPDGADEGDDKGDEEETKVVFDEKGPIGEQGPLDLSTKTNKELTEMLELRGVEVPKKATKSELLKLLGVKINE